MRSEAHSPATALLKILSGGRGVQLQNLDTEEWQALAMCCLLEQNPKLLSLIHEVDEADLVIFFKWLGSVSLDLLVDLAGAREDSLNSSQRAYAEQLLASRAPKIQSLQAAVDSGMQGVKSYDLTFLALDLALAEMGLPSTSHVRTAIGVHLAEQNLVDAIFGPARPAALLDCVWAWRQSEYRVDEARSPLRALLLSLKFPPEDPRRYWAPHKTGSEETKDYLLFIVGAWLTSAWPAELSGRQRVLQRWLRSLGFEQGTSAQDDDWSEEDSGW